MPSVGKAFEVTFLNSAHFDVLGYSRARTLFVWLTGPRLATLDQYIPVPPLALWCGVTSSLCQSEGSHFFFPAASIQWPHSVCSNQGVQEISTYKTKSLWAPKTFLKLSKKILHRIKWKVTALLKKSQFSKSEAKGKLTNVKQKMYNIPSDDCMFNCLNCLSVSLSRSFSLSLGIFVLFYFAKLSIAE